MTGPDRAVARARTAVRACGFAPGDRVIVACSGGQDSLALAAAAAFCAARDGWTARVVVVDHGLRDGSAADAARTLDLAAQLGLAGEAVRVTVPGGPAGTGHGGPEAAARRARREALLAAARRLGARAVLLGHTLDDQAETVLLALARGSGARSLSGMAAVDGLWHRPLLELRRAETARICEVLGLRVVPDETNEIDGPWRAADGSALRRAAIRHRVLPLLTEVLGPGVPGALARTAGQLRRDDEALTRMAEDLADRARRPGPHGGTRFDLGELRAAHPAVRTRALKDAMQSLARPGAQVGAAHVAAADRLVRVAAAHGPAYGAGGVIARREDGMLWMSQTLGEPSGR